MFVDIGRVGRRAGWPAAGPVRDAPGARHAPRRERSGRLRVRLGDGVDETEEVIPLVVVIDAVTRLLPGALGDDQSSVEESFSHGLLEYPHWTRPAEFRGWKVPDVLMSGNHAEIARWRRLESLRRTAERRPDLWEQKRWNRTA